MDDSSKTRLMDASIQKNLSVRRASVTARNSKRTSFAPSPAAYIQSKRAAIDFQILALQAEVKVLEELKGMEDDTELLFTSLFEVLVDNDDNEAKEVDAPTLSLGLSGVNGSGFRAGMEEAVEYLSNLDTIDNPKEFGEVAAKCATLIGCTPLELAQMIVMAVLFEEEHSLSGAMANMEKLEKAAEKQQFQKAAHDERMKSLYKLFDFTNDGKVSFKEVVLGLYKITEDIEGTSKAAVDALLVMEEEDTRFLTYDQFAKLIMNVVAAHSGHVRFEDIADKLTVLAAQPSNFDTKSIQHLFAMDRTLQRAVEDMKINEDTKQMEPVGSGISTLSTVEKGKAGRLFDMWDLDQDGMVDFHELALGLRKFQETTAIKTNIEQCIAIMHTFDANSDQKLDRSEFANFLRNFATQQHAGAAMDSAHAKAAFLDMVDFMIVTTALKENSATEKAYIESLSAGDIYYWGC